MEELNKELMEEVVEVAADTVVPAAMNEDVMRILAKLGGLGLGVGAIVLALKALYKKFGVKLDEAEARRLAKKGYVISKPDEPKAEEEPEKDSKK